MGWETLCFVEAGFRACQGEGAGCTAEGMVGLGGGASVDFGSVHCGGDEGEGVGVVSQAVHVGRAHGVLVEADFEGCFGATFGRVGGADVPLVEK